MRKELDMLRLLQSYGRLGPPHKRKEEEGIWGEEQFSPFDPPRPDDAGSRPDDKAMHLGTTQETIFCRSKFKEEDKGGKVVRVLLANCS